MLVAALFVASSLNAQTAGEVQTKFSAAAELYNAKNYVEAIPLFEETVDLAQTCEDDVASILSQAEKLVANSYLRVGMVAAKEKNFEEALSLLDKSSAAADGIDQGIKNNAEKMIGMVYKIQGGDYLAAEQYTEAAETFAKGVERNDKNTELAILAAQSYSKAGNAEKAEELYKGVISLSGLNSKFAAAAEEAKTAYATDMLSTAIEDAQAGKFDQVNATVEKVFEIAPGNATAYMILLDAASAAKKYDVITTNGAAAVEAQTTDEDKSNASMILGVAYQNKGDKAKAIAAYNAVTAGPNVAAAKGAAAELAK